MWSLLLHLTSQLTLSLIEDVINSALCCTTWRLRRFGKIVWNWNKNLSKGINPNLSLILFWVPKAILEAWNFSIHMYYLKGLSSISLTPFSSLLPSGKDKIYGFFPHTQSFSKKIQLNPWFLRTYREAPKNLPLSHRPLVEALTLPLLISSELGFWTGLVL